MADIQFTNLIRAVNYTVKRGQFVGFCAYFGSSSYFILIRKQKYFQMPDGTLGTYVYYKDTNSNPNTTAGTGYTVRDFSNYTIRNIDRLPKFDYASYAWTNQPNVQTNGTLNNSGKGFPSTSWGVLPSEIDTTEFNALLDDLSDTGLSTDPTAWKEHIQNHPSKRTDLMPIYLNDFQEHTDPYYDPLTDSRHAINLPNENTTVKTP